MDQQPRGEQNPADGPGKKNWMFCGSEEVGERDAMVHTLIANCRLHGIEPCEYLKDVLARLPSTPHQHVAELTPLHWKNARQKPAGQSGAGRCGASKTLNPTRTAASNKRVATSPLTEEYQQALKVYQVI